MRNADMKFIRFIIGRLILWADFLTRPTPLVRAPSRQAKVDKLASTMSLYQFNACPFCVKVRRHLRRNSLNIELRDAKNNISFKNELIKEGGKHKVPCLRIKLDSNNIKWLYSSGDICSYLDSELAQLKD